MFVYFLGKSKKETLRFFSVFGVSMVLFSLAPFVVFGWSPLIILQHWNAHFTVGGGLSFMTFLESLKDSYQLTGGWWIMGWLWVPALGFAAYELRSRIRGFKDLLKSSLALLLIFFLCRSWVSEPNIVLILPMVFILTALRELDHRFLVAIWFLPLLFSLFNTSIAQLFFPSMPAVMDGLLQLSVEYDPARFILRTLVVIAWLVVGWWIVIECFKQRNGTKLEEISN
jgi:hypothetical protein